MISLTIFKNKFDNLTHKRMDFKSFDDFERLLIKLSKVKFVSKQKAQLISPATYLPSTKRRNVNVVDWGGWAALDIDDWKPKGNLKEEILKKFGTYRFLCYSTPTSSKDQPKFRMVFALKYRLDADNIKPFWFALNTLAGSIGDKQTKDLSRMFYIPGDYETSSYQFIFNNGGEYMDPLKLIEMYPAPIKNSQSLFDRLPTEIQRRIIEHKKSALQNTSIKWTGYRDCPFWPKKLEMEYRAIGTTGWYHKLYQIMVAIAGKAVDKEYPISVHEIVTLCREFDAETGGWYKDRPLEIEAERALEFVYRGM